MTRDSHSMPASAGHSHDAKADIVPPAPPTVPEPDPGRWRVGGSIWVGAVALAVLVFGIGGWAVLARLSGAVLASGQVEVESHRQIVQHLDGGIVEGIFVREGDLVEAGQVLLRLDGRMLRSELAIVEGQYFEILARRGRLEAERASRDDLTFPELLVKAAQDDPSIDEVMAGQTSLFLARRDTQAQALEQFGRQITQIEAQRRGIDAQIAALDHQRRLIGRELADAESLLGKGLAQAPRVLALEREAARMDGQLGELEASRAQSEARMTEIDIMRLRQIAARREEAETALSDMAEDELRLAERRRNLSESIARLEIRAPVAGVVHQLGITTPRAVIRAAEPILYLIPQDRPLVVVAQVAPIDIDQVGIGQPVALRFSAFSQRTTPEIEGRLAGISADAVIDDLTRMTYYRAEITIPPEEQAKLGALTLIPGMPAEVFIRTGEQSPMHYLLKPFTDYLSRAMRES